MDTRLKAAITGQKVLDGLAKGRQQAIEQARERVARKQMMIVILVNQDRDSGKPARGMAGRISRKLHGQISERLVRKYLARLSGGADSSRQYGAHIINGGAS